MKSIIEDSATSSTGSGIPAVTSEGSAKAQEALLAEAAKLLKGVSLKHLRVHEGEDALQELGIDKSWLISAVSGASDSNFALVDSGATNGLRSATLQELEGARKIKVDLAAGGTHLHINEHGTLLSAQPCQVILPAGYLVQLGFSITWRRKGCVIKRRGKPALEVTVRKGCPLVSKEQGLKLLQEYEALRELGDIPALKGLSEEPAMVIPKAELRAWLATKVASGVLTRQDQLVWLRSMFPDVSSSILSRVAGNDTGLQSPSLGGVPWNRRRRRTILRAKPGEVLLHLFSGSQNWKLPGLVVEVEKSKGCDLLGEGVWDHLLLWAIKGVLGGVVMVPQCLVTIWVLIHGLKTLQTHWSWLSGPCNRRLRICNHPRFQPPKTMPWLGRFCLLGSTQGIRKSMLAMPPKRLARNHLGGHSPSGMILGGFMGYTWLLSIRVPWVIGVLNPLVWAQVVGGCLRRCMQGS